MKQTTPHMQKSIDFKQSVEPYTYKKSVYFRKRKKIFPISPWQASRLEFELIPTITEEVLYFLFKGLLLVYVGHTTKPLSKRINVHSKDKKFNIIRYVTVSQMKELEEEKSFTTTTLAAYERKFIKVFKPLYNTYHRK